MKILYIYSSIASLAGMERILTDKMNYLADVLNHEVYLITYEQGDHPLSFPLSSLVKHIDIDVLFYAKWRYRFFVRLWHYCRMRKRFKERFYALLRQIQPDIMVSTIYSLPLLDMIVNAPIQSKRILETHITKRVLSKAKEFFRFSLLYWGGKMYDFYVMRQIRKFDVVVTLTHQDELLWKRKAKTVVSIPNVLTFYPSESSDLEAKKVISVGRLVSQKGYDLLIDVWKLVNEKYSDWELHIWGNGSDKEVLLQRITQANLEHSLFLHPATPDIYTQYLSHSIYVMSSRYEGFGLVLIEAMSCGLPCVSFDCPSGPSEIIGNNQDGYLVENGNVQDMAERICCLIENKEVRKQMGKVARKKALSYLKESVMPQWNNLFLRLCQ